MSAKILGIHHVTAVSGAPHINYDFYTRVLGLKLVKKTVNFDDPTTYHLYYGDDTGSPGSLITFFPYEALSGRPGAGQVTATTYAVKAGELPVWERRLREHGVEVAIETRFGKPHLRFSDPDGIGLEIVEADEAPDRLGKFSGAVISLVEASATRELLEFLGYQLVAQEENYHRMSLAGSTEFLDLEVVPAWPASGGPGTVHHIALRVADDEEQIVWRDRLEKAGYHVSPVMDRNYFHSIYFRGPEGVLFELATDAPGMLVDESAQELGTILRLPAQYESERAAIQERLAPLESPYRTFEKPGETPILVGLHGTGGDEHDLVATLTEIDSDAGILGLRGQVSEESQNRFFRRDADGNFDQDDLFQRSAQLAKFLGSRPEPKVVVGYSNGANIAAHAAMFHPEAIDRAVLIRPMQGWVPPVDVDLSKLRVLILIGSSDDIVGPGKGRRLVKSFRALGAQVEVHELPTGHALTPEDIALTRRWLTGVPST